MLKRIIFILLVLFINKLDSQWENNVPLYTTNIGLSLCENNARSLVTKGDTIHLVYDFGVGFRYIYYIRSTNNGESWGISRLLSTNIDYSMIPSIAISDNTLHVVWFRDGPDYIYYARSTDGGNNWDSARAIENNLNESVYPSIAAAVQYVYVTWTDNRNGTYQIFFKYSSNGGNTWSSDMQLSQESSNCEYPSICLLGDAVHLAWSMPFDYTKIRYIRSTNHGNNWSSVININDFSVRSSKPSLLTDGSLLRVVWQAYVPPNGYITEVYSDFSTNNGVTWNQDKRVTDSLKFASNPNMFSAGSVLHLVWRENRQGSLSPIYKRSYDGGNTWTDELLLFSTQNSTTHELGAPAVSVSGNTVHTVWVSYINSNNNTLFYKRNLTGNIHGIELISSQKPNHFTLSQNYPNPFNPQTSIEFKIAEAGHVSLIIYDMLGREKERVVNSALRPGIYKVNWSASNYPSGVYFYRLVAGKFTETKRMVLVK